MLFDLACPIKSIVILITEFFGEGIKAKFYNIYHNCSYGNNTTLKRDKTHQ